MMKEQLFLVKKLIKWLIKLVNYSIILRYTINKNKIKKYQYMSMKFYWQKELLIYKIKIINLKVRRFIYGRNRRRRKK